MTVCIAAINQKHKLIAFATDRMVTANFPPMEFEHSLPKLTQINEYCVALSAGDALIGKEIFDNVIRQTAGETNPSIIQIVERAKEIYQRKRLQILEATQLRTRGINHQIFIENGAKILPPSIYTQIDYAFATFSLPVESIIAGVDESGPYIYGIRNPGVVSCYNSIGFHAIGTGSMHALVSLIETYNPTTNEAETMYSVFRAKKVAEVAPGVGQRTDFGIGVFSQKIKYLEENDELIKKFSELYKEEENARRGLITKAKLGIVKVGDEGKAATKETTQEVQIKSGKK
jgi:20S proteasome alpha/beta subunit